MSVLNTVGMDYANSNIGISRYISFSLRTNLKMQTYKIMRWFFIFQIAAEKADVEPTSSELVLPASFDSRVFFFKKTRGI